MKKILIAIIICLSLNSVYGQDKVKISELPVYTGTPAGALVPVVVGGINRKMDGYYFASMKIDSVWFVGNTLYVKKNGVTVSSDHTHPQSQITNLADSLLARYTKTEIQALLTLKLNISDSAAMLSPYARTQRLTDSLAAAQSRIQTKEPLLGYTPVPNTRTVNGHALSSDVTVTKSDVGLGNVPNVDATNASNISSGTLADARLSGNVTVQGNSFNGANQLVKTGSDGKLLPGVIPALALVDTYTPASQAAMLALPAEQGDIAIRTDINVAYILYQAPATTLGNWIALPAPSSETDPLYTASSWYSTTNNSSNWNTAYSWGNHAGLYLPVTGGSINGQLRMGNYRFISGSGIYDTTNSEIGFGSTSTALVANAVTKYNGAAGTVITYIGGSEKLRVASSLITAGANFTVGSNSITAGAISGTTADFSGTGKFGGGTGQSLSSGSIDVLKDIGMIATQGIVVGSSRIVSFNNTYTLNVAGSIGATTGTFSGDVLIGTGSPISALSVVRNTASGNISDYAAVTVSNSNGAGYSAFAHYVGATYVGGLRYFASTDALDLQSYGSLVVKTGTSFTTALTIASNQDITAAKDIYTAADMRGLYFAGTRNAILGSNSADEVYIAAGNATRITVKSTEVDFGVAVTSPSGFNTTSTGTAYWTKTSARLMATDNLSLLDFSASTSGHYIGSNFYGGGAYYSITMSANSASYPSQFVLNTNGTIVAASSITATAFYEPSDIRLKNILWSKRSADGIPTIAYNWKDTKRDTKLHYGYSAQQVMRYLPDAVELDVKGIYKLDYNQVHTFKISIHDTEIYDLKNRISQLEKQLKR